MPGERMAGAALRPGLVRATRRPRAPLHPDPGCGMVSALPALPRTGWMRSPPPLPARLVPALTLLGQLIARGTSVTDVAPRPIEPVVPWKGNRSHETYSLYCSRYVTGLPP